MLETDLQAQFLIPIAVSLAFGVMFATFVTLILVPAIYLILDDFRNAAGWLVGGATGGGQHTDLGPSVGSAGG